MFTCAVQTARFGGCFSWSVGLSGVASLCARSRGEPSSAHCEQRLSERLTPCPCDPVCACTRMRGHATKGKKLAKGWKTRQPRSQRSPAFLPAHLHAAQRAVTGWRGGLGRVGADLASAGSMRPPPSPARHVSTAWLATTHASRETAHHHQSQARIATPPDTSAEKPTAPTQPHSNCNCPLTSR